MKKLFAIHLAGFLSTFAAFAGDFRHIVMFQFKPDATPEQVKEIELAFGKLPGQIDLIKDFEWGTMDNAEVGLNQGFSHSFLVTFKTKADLEKYLPHASHQDFVAKLKPIMEKALIFDYEAKEKP